MKAILGGFWVLGAVAAVSLGACGGGDEDSPSTATDSGVAEVATDTGVAIDTGVGTDTGTDVATDAPPVAAAKLTNLELSKTFHDRLYGLAYAPSGELFATGVLGESADDLAMIVVKFKKDGSLDTTFGTMGIAKKNVIAKKAGEVARGIVVQSTGKIVIAGTVEHEGATDERDRDIAVVRFNADGTVDSSFGTAGVVILDLSAGELVGTTYVADNQWGLSLGAADALVVTGVQKATGRTDSDFAIVKLKADGARDTTFGTNGVATVDIDNLSTTMRTATVLSDGSVVGAGYYTDADKVVRPVLFKLTPTGTLDTTFGKSGIFNEALLPAAAEAYGAAPQGSSFITVGYGRATTTESLDWLSFRIGGDGKQDKTYGTSGMARLDLAGNNDNGRALVVLPDQRVFMVGGGRPAADNSDGMTALLTKDGAPDTTYGPKGIKTWDLGGPNDFFWGVAVSPAKDQIAVVGLKGAATGGTDDAVLLTMPMPK